MLQFKLALYTINKEPNQAKHTEFFLKVTAWEIKFLHFLNFNAKKTTMYLWFLRSACDEILAVSKQKQKWGRWNKNYYLRSQQHKVVKRQCCWTEIVKTLDKNETFSVHVLTACVHKQYRISERNEKEGLMDKSTVHSDDKTSFSEERHKAISEERHKAILKIVKMMWFLDLYKIFIMYHCKVCKFIPHSLIFICVKFNVASVFPNLFSVQV